MSFSKRLSSGLLVAGLSLAAITGCNNGGKTPGGSTATSAATKAVGAVDQEVLLTLPEFKAAEEKLKKEGEKLQKELEGSLPKDGQLSAEQRKKIAEAQNKMQKLRNQTLDPLKTRLEGAVLAVSREKKLQVVVDKRIVVYGVEDVTEDVKKLFQSKDALKTGEEVDTSKSPIGYFDQDVVRSLKVFDTAELKVFERRQKMQVEFQKRQADLSPSERQMMMERMSMELESYRQQLFEPLMSQVQSAVKEVAEAQGVSLVLDKQHVMQGGRNMTNDVVETFLKKANVGEKKPKANASATPAPAETP